MFEHAFVNTSLKSSILFFPERKQRGIDRSYYILKNEGYFCFVSRPSDLLRKGGQRKCVLKARLWFCFNFKRARAKARKAVRGRIGASWIFAPFEEHIGTSFFEVICSFFLFFLFLLLLLLLYLYVFRLFEYSYRIFDGTETLGRSSFIFTRGSIFSSFPIFSGITSFYRNDLDFSLRLELRRASRRRLNLILSCFIYRFVHLIWNGMS